MAVGQAERDIRGAAGGVDAQLFAQAADKGENLQARSRHGTDRHDERINHDVMRRNAEIGGAFDDLLGDSETHIGVF